MTPPQLVISEDGFVVMYEDPLETWVMRNGISVPIRAMSDDHLEQAIRKLCDRYARPENSGFAIATKSHVYRLIERLTIERDERAAGLRTRRPNLLYLMHQKIYYAAIARGKDGYEAAGKAFREQPLYLSRHRINQG